LHGLLGLFSNAIDRPVSLTLLTLDHVVLDSEPIPLGLVSCFMGTDNVLFESFEFGLVLADRPRIRDPAGSFACLTHKHVRVGSLSAPKRSEFLNVHRDVGPLQ